MITPEMKIPNRRRGFTLLEVMFAVMILGVGLIAVASIIPVAGAMQKRTIEEIEAQQVGRSARAYLQARGIDRVIFIDGSGEVKLLTGAQTEQHCPLEDRSAPASLPLLQNGQANRDWYWRPLYRKDATTGDVHVYVIVMRRTGVDAPEPSASPDNKVSLGGTLLVDKNQTVGGREYKAGDVVIVTDINNIPTGWHAPKGTTSYIVAAGTEVAR
jgi:prepilin-type N-terminal cleavage/methylation domain-containing protein